MLSSPSIFLFLSGSMYFGLFFKKPTIRWKSKIFAITIKSLKLIHRIPIIFQNMLLLFVRCLYYRLCTHAAHIDLVIYNIFRSVVQNWFPSTKRSIHSRPKYTLGSSLDALGYFNWCMKIKQCLHFTLPISQFSCASFKFIVWIKA